MRHAFQRARNAAKSDLKKVGEEESHDCHSRRFRLAGQLRCRAIIGIQDVPASSRGFLMVITQYPAQSLAALHSCLAVDVCIAREQQDVGLPLMIALLMVMLDVLSTGSVTELRSTLGSSLPAGDVLTSRTRGASARCPTSVGNRPSNESYLFALRCCLLRYGRFLSKRCRI